MNTAIYFIPSNKLVLKNIKVYLYYHSPGGFTKIYIIRSNFVGIVKENISTVDRG